MSSKPSGKTPNPRAPRRGVESAIIVLAEILLLYAMWNGGLPLPVSITVALISLIVSGTLISRANGFPGGYGLYLVKTKRGLRTIDGMAVKHRRIWTAIVDWGFVLSFGILSYVFFRKYVSRKMLALGTLSIIIFQIAILPYLAVSMSLVSLPRFAVQQQATYAQSPGVMQYIGVAFAVISVIGGFASYMMAQLLFLAGIVIKDIALFAINALTLHGITVTAQSLPAPAGVPVLIIPFLEPQIALPLVLSLILLITLHEVSHGVIARHSRIRLKSVGSILFGIIPAGAFVEPDEKSILKLPKMQQDKISIAGISMNMFLAALSFVPLVLMLYLVMPGIMANHIVVTSTAHGSPAANASLAGSTILEWNHHQISNLSDLETAASSDLPGSTVVITTQNRTLSLTANSTGKVGVFLSEESVPKSNDPASSLVYFVYVFLALSFMLNFYLAVFNVLPIPFFDGFRIYKLNMNPRILNLLVVATLAAFFLLFLPWLWSA